MNGAATFLNTVIIGVILMCGDVSVEYDVNKIVSYPGFNVDPPEGTVDVSMAVLTKTVQNFHQGDV